MISLGRRGSEMSKILVTLDKYSTLSVTSHIAHSNFKPIFILECIDIFILSKKKLNF